MISSAYGTCVEEKRLSALFPIFFFYIKWSDIVVFKMNCQIFAEFLIFRKVYE